MSGRLQDEIEQLKVECERLRGARRKQYQRANRAEARVAALEQKLAALSADERAREERLLAQLREREERDENVRKEAGRG